MSGKNGRAKNEGMNLPNVGFGSDDFSEYDFDTIGGRADAVRKLLDGFGLNEDNDPKWMLHLFSGYDILNDSGMYPKMVRKFSNEELELFHAGTYRATGEVPALTPYLTLIHPMFSTFHATLATDQYYRMAIGAWYFDPSVTAANRGTMIIHEIMHCVLGHQKMRAVSNEIANLAGDAIINQQIEHSSGIGDELPKNPDNSDVIIFPRGLKTGKYPDGMKERLDFWEYYNAIIDDFDDDGNRKDFGAKKMMGTPFMAETHEDGNAKGGDVFIDGKYVGNINGLEPEGNQGSKDEGESGSDGQSDKTGNGSDGQTGNGEDDADGNGSDGQSGDGSDESDGNGHGNGSEGGSRRKNGKGIANAKNPCTSMPSEESEALGDANVETATEVEEEMAKQESLLRAMDEQQKGRGTSGSDLNSFILSSLRPSRVDWRKVFSTIISRAYNSIIAGHTDISYRKANRRRNDNPDGILFPGQVAYAPTVVVGCDTSGSMSTDDYEAALGEVDGILKKGSAPKVRFVTVDTEITGDSFVASPKELRLDGGGGTIMKVFYDYINSMNPSKKPDLTVLMTDGGIDWEDAIAATDKKRRNIILVTDRGGYESYKSMFGKKTVRGLTVLPIYKEER